VAAHPVESRFHSNREAPRIQTHRAHRKQSHFPLSGRCCAFLHFKVNEGAVIWIKLGLRTPLFVSYNDDTMIAIVFGGYVHNAKIGRLYIVSQIADILLCWEHD
jgi:hypothetical protein